MGGLHLALVAGPSNAMNRLIKQWVDEKCGWKCKVEVIKGVGGGEDIK